MLTLMNEMMTDKNTINQNSIMVRNGILTTVQITNRLQGGVAIKYNISSGVLSITMLDLQRSCLAAD